MLLQLKGGIESVRVLPVTQELSATTKGLCQRVAMRVCLETKLYQHNFTSTFITCTQ